MTPLFPSRNACRALVFAALASLSCIAAESPAPPTPPSAAAPRTAAQTGLGKAMSGFWRFLLPQHDVQVITVTDATPQGALLRSPSPANPVYYIAVNAGYHDFGGIIAGIKEPPARQVISTIGKVLAKQGYLPATKIHPPTQVLIMAWGTMNVETFDPTGSAMSPSEAPQVNRTQMLRFLGAYKLGLVAKEANSLQDPSVFGLMIHDAKQTDFMDAASDDLYVAAIASYDYSAMLQKKKVLLWTTKISCPALGLDLTESLPTMLAIAGPNIGRETAEPVWVSATDKFKPDVQIGEARVIDMFDADHMPVVDASKAKPKPGSRPSKKR